MLFHRAWADLQPGRNLFVAAALDQEFQSLPVPWRNFHLLQVDHARNLLHFFVAGSLSIKMRARVSPDFHPLNTGELVLAVR